MTKPFGKPVRRSFGFTRSFRLTAALWVTALPAFLICKIPSRGYPTFARSPFFWPSVLASGLFYAFSIAMWLKRRPSPRGPWESGKAKLIAVRFLLALVVAAPAGFASGYLYEPMLTVMNGMISPGGGSAEYATVAKEKGGFVLDSPYWEPDFRLPVPDPKSVPGDLTPGSLARMSLRRGLLGARWIEKIDYEVLP